GGPLVRSLRHRLVVSEVVTESPTLTSVVLTGRNLHRMPVRAGPFFQWRFLDGPGWSRANPYSSSAAPGGRASRRLWSWVSAPSVSPVVRSRRCCRPATVT
ncbi:MAG: hypothetical protein ABIQ53_09585, partial [Terracoccus sp.]